MLGSLQYGSGIVSSLLLAAFSGGTAWIMGWIIVLFCAVSAVFANVGKRVEKPTAFLRLSEKLKQRFRQPVCKRRD